MEWLALIAAVGISIWCMAKPLGGPKYELRDPSHLLGAFVSRTSWGGVAGRATVGEVFKDIGIFIEGWIVELIFRLYDAELENTHAYALFILLLPGLLLLWFKPCTTVEPRQRISGPP